jgi:hypothetical protein
MKRRIMAAVSESSFFRNWSDEDSAQSFARNHFLNLIGAKVEYYGADEASNTFNVDGVVFKVLEDPDDGYRSYLKTIDYTDKHDSIFFKSSIALVSIEIYDIKKEDEYLSQANRGYRLVDAVDKHVWLSFGTHNYDDYYPMFIFRHTPKER